MFGDERDSLRGVAPSARAIISGVLADAPDFVLGTGDLVVQGGRRSDWLSLLDSHASMFAQLPYFPALGNHELIGDSDGRMFKDLFPRAATGYYSVRYGQVQVVVLNGNRPGDPAQTRFLEDELRRAATDPAVRARLVLMHQAPLSASWHCGVGPYVADWMALFERYQVDAVLAGHDHSYQRLERNGVAYFVSGGGGAPLYEQGRCDPHDELALQHYAAVHHYMLVRITPDQRPQTRHHHRHRSCSPGPAARRGDPAPATHQAGEHDRRAPRSQRPAAVPPAGAPGLDAAQALWRPVISRARRAVRRGGGLSSGASPPSSSAERLGR